MSVWSFARRTILNPHSRACFWKHPIQAGRLVGGAAVNFALPVVERVLPAAVQECPVCGWQGQRLRTYVSPTLVMPATICPRCGSFDRHRHLVLGIRGELERARRVPQALLGLSLTGAMSYLLAQEGLGRCFRSDFDNTDPRYAPDVIVDLRTAGFRNEVFDWIVCSHVLEHIDELAPTLDEMVRILRPGGVAWIQVPVDDDLAGSVPVAVIPHDLDAHAWRFGRDFDEVLAHPGWTVTCHRAAEELDPATRRRFGIHPVERYWLARKRD